MEFSHSIAWIDLLWIPFGLLLVPKKLWVKATLFVLCNMLTLRLQVQLMNEIGYPAGIFNILDFPILYRGFIIYGVLTAFFWALVSISQDNDPYIFMAAAISVFMAAFCMSSFIMVL